MQVDFDNAIVDYTSALSFDPTLTVAHFNRGTVHYRLGRFDLGLDDLQKAADADPVNREYREGLEACKKAKEK